MKLKISVSILMFFLMNSMTIANSNVQYERCSGVVFMLEGMKDTDKAKVISNGHCRSGTFPSKEKESANKVIMNDVMDGMIFLYKDIEDLGGIFYKKVEIYLSMHHYDIAILELSSTYKELKEKGYKVYTVSRRGFELNGTYSFISDYMQTKSTCTVESEVDTLLEAVWTFKNVSKMKISENCKLIHGNSGTAGIKDDKVYGLAFTMYEGLGTPCSRNNPCELENGKKRTSRPGRVYAQSVNYLYDCYSQEKGKFDFALKNCPLISK